MSTMGFVFMTTGVKSGHPDQVLNVYNVGVRGLDSPSF